MAQDCSCSSRREEDEERLVCRSPSRRSCFSLQLRSIESTSCRKKTESPAAQRGSTQNRRSAGPAALRKLTRLKPSSWKSSSTGSAPPSLPAAPPKRTTAAPSAPAEARGGPLCFSHVGLFCSFLKDPSGASLFYPPSFQVTSTRPTMKRLYPASHQTRERRSSPGGSTTHRSS